MANNSELTKISPSKRDIYAKYLDIASKYTDIENEDFLKSGLFGYITESLAAMTRDSVIHKSMLYNESFLNTARMPKSIYNWAKMFNIEVSEAVPSYAEILITIPKESLERLRKTFTIGSKEVTTFGNDVLEKKGIILNKFDPIIAGDYYFSLEHSILIYEDGSEMKARYISSEVETTNFQTLASKVLTISQDTTGKNYKIYARAYQYKINVFEKQVSSSSFLNTKIHLFEFDNQFAGAKLFYSKGNSRQEPIRLKYTNLESSSSDEKFAYYSLSNEKTLQIKFSSTEGNFIPEPNSTLYLYLFSTNGAGVPSRFSGNAVMTPSSETLRTLPVTITFEPQTILGGFNAPSLEKIKETIINEISTRDVIVTENDLNNYFKIITSLIRSLNGGELKFIRRRDDILKRVFSSYILMRDGIDVSNELSFDPSYLSKCIPTNTISADFQISSDISKPFGSILKRKEDSSTEFEYVSEVTDTDDDYYVIPFFMRIILNPFKKIKYIFDLADSSSVLSYDDSKDLDTEKLSLIPNNVSIKRGMNGTNAEDGYTISFSFTTNQKVSESFSAADVNDTIKIGLYNKNTGLKIDGSVSESSFVIQSKEDSENYFTTTFSFLFKVDETEFDFSDQTASSDYGSYIHIKGFEKGLSENVQAEIEFNKFKFNSIAEIKSGKFRSVDYMTLFKNLDEIMTSDVEVNSAKRFEYTEYTISDGTNNYTVFSDLEDDNFLSRYEELDVFSGGIEGFNVISTVPRVSEVLPSIQYYGSIDKENRSRSISSEEYEESRYITHLTIHNIPVVHSSFFNTESNQTNFITQLFSYIDILKENLTKLETNTFFDLKFFNTYGPSQYYPQALSTNISLEMRITLIDAYKEDEDIKNSIRDYIRRAIDSSNTGEALKISSIIALVQQAATYGTYISHIDFIGLNGSLNQFISKDLSIPEKNYAPEWLNIDRDNLQNIMFV